MKEEKRFIFVLADEREYFLDKQILRINGFSLPIVPFGVRFGRFLLNAFPAIQVCISRNIYNFSVI